VLLAPPATILEHGRMRITLLMLLLIVALNLNAPCPTPQQVTDQPCDNLSITGLAHCPK